MELSIKPHDPKVSPRGVVLMLHGGSEESTAKPVRGLHGGYLRMEYLHWCIRSELARHGLSSWLVRNRFTSWNAPVPSDEPAPVVDARTAVAEARAQHPEVPIVLVGHSMGGRAAAWAADESAVTGVIGLAPWWPQDDPVETLEGRRLAAAVNPGDTEVDPELVAAYVKRAKTVCIESSYTEIGNPVPIPNAEHGMLTNFGSWHGFIISNAQQFAR